MIACFLKPTKMHPPFYISIGGEDGVHFQPDYLVWMNFIVLRFRARGSASHRKAACP